MLMPYGSKEFGPLHEDPLKNLRLENELLELKIRAEFGGYSGSNARLPPEVENAFLKKVIEFEQKFRAARLVKVSDLIGNPVFKKAWELTDMAVIAELKRLRQLLSQKNIDVVFIRERDARFQYKFITEELLKMETEDVHMPGMSKCFMYEEFHPDHEITIRDRTKMILSAWFQRNPSMLSTYLANQFIQPDGIVFPRELQKKRMQDWMNSYVRLEDCGFSITKISYIIKKDDPFIQAMGHSEGRLKYVAVTPEGWKKVIEGPFKIYYTCEGGWWSSFFFYLPGFNA